MVAHGMATRLIREAISESLSRKCRLHVRLECSDGVDHIRREFLALLVAQTSQALPHESAKCAPKVSPNLTLLEHRVDERITPKVQQSVPDKTSFQERAQRQQVSSPRRFRDWRLIVDQFRRTPWLHHLLHVE